MGGNLGNTPHCMLCAVPALPCGVKVGYTHVEENSRNGPGGFRAVL